MIVDRYMCKPPSSLITLCSQSDFTLILFGYSELNKTIWGICANFFDRRNPADAVSYGRWPHGHLHKRDGDNF